MPATVATPETPIAVLLTSQGPARGSQLAAARPLCVILYAPLRPPASTPFVAAAECSPSSVLSSAAKTGGPATTSAADEDERAAAVALLNHTAPPVSSSPAASPTRANPLNNSALTASTPAAAAGRTPSVPTTPLNRLGGARALQPSWLGQTASRQQPLTPIVGGRGGGASAASTGGRGGALNALYSQSADSAMMRKLLQGPDQPLIAPPILPADSPVFTSSPPHIDGGAGGGPPVFTIVFDLDETLVCNRFPGKAVIRPHALDTLKAIASLSSPSRIVELVLWTASVESVAREVLSRLDPRGDLFRHHIFRDRRWFKETGYTKDLRRLGRDMTRTVIVENSPNSVMLNRHQSLLVKDFLGHAPNDKDLAVVRDIICDWITSQDDADSGQPQRVGGGCVPIADYLRSHPKVSPANHVVVEPQHPTAPMSGAARGRANGGLYPRGGIFGRRF